MPVRHHHHVADLRQREGPPARVLTPRLQPNRLAVVLVRLFAQCAAIGGHDQPVSNLHATPLDALISNDVSTNIEPAEGRFSPGVARC